MILRATPPVCNSPPVRLALRILSLRLGGINLHSRRKLKRCSRLGKSTPYSQKNLPRTSRAAPRRRGSSKARPKPSVTICFGIRCTRRRRDSCSPASAAALRITRAVGCLANGTDFSALYSRAWKTKTNPSPRFAKFFSRRRKAGLIPNGLAGGGGTPDRSQPPVGSYAVWKVLQRYPDRATLEFAYPRLKRWHEWWFKDRGDGQPWRDGNRDGLLEWGSNRGSRESSGGRGFRLQAGWESGMDDSPMYDGVHFSEQTHTMDLDDVGLNSLYALDAECLAQLATALGKTDDAKLFQADYEKMKQLVQEKLWNEADGIYENRSWNGEFSKRLSPTNFYPMLAGIATPEQAKRMVNEHLLNPKEFWGEYVVPTAPRNDPAFDDQYYWRGSIWGPTNYLLYHALDRYDFDPVALDFARKSYALFMDDWKTNQRNDELYHAWGGSGGGDTHYTWGTLLCLIPVEQFIDVNPWDGLRFGALDPPSNGSLHRVPLDGHTYDVTIAPNETTLVRDGKSVFHADAGVVVRNYLFSPNDLSFRISASRASTITLSEFKSAAPMPFPLGVTIDGQVVRKLKFVSGFPVLSVPAGEHSIAAALPPS